MLPNNISLTYRSAPAPFPSPWLEGLCSNLESCAAGSRSIKHRLEKLDVGGDGLIVHVYTVSLTKTDAGSSLSFNQ